MRTTGRNDMEIREVLERVKSVTREDLMEVLKDGEEV